MKRDDAFYAAMLARDHRFDGKFFVGVKTTGIYCRPICPAKPKRQNVEFFQSHLDAERAGYRPCLRCRPESAPLSPAWIGKSAVVQRAVRALSGQHELEFNEDQFAQLFGVTARHLRRLFVQEIGKTPKQLAFENRLNLARKLIVESSLPLSEIAFAAGFKSIRRFNAAFKERFKKNPTAVRRNKAKADYQLQLTLPYRPPYDFAGLLAVYESHRIGDLEWFADGKMHRLVELNGKVGKISISDSPEKSQLILEIDFPDTSLIHQIITRVRNLFDLESDPLIIANALEVDPKIQALVQKHPGLRLPSGWDPFEIAVSTILGQLVSVEQGRILVSDLIEMLGQGSGVERNGKEIKLFPTAKAISASTLQGLRTTAVRKQALSEFAKAVDEKRLSLEPTQDVDDFMKNVTAIKGLGPWTAQYMAMKALRHTDTFPETDLILARALDIHPIETIRQMSPWRAYVATLMWKEYALKLKKPSLKKERKKTA